MGNDACLSSLNHLLECSIKSSTLYPLGPVSTLICMAVGHPQQTLFWWEITTARSFIAYVWHNVCHALGARIGCSAFHSVKAVVCQVSHNALVEYKNLAVAIFHQSGVCWGWFTATQIKVETGPQEESGSNMWTHPGSMCTGGVWWPRSACRS